MNKKIVLISCVSKKLPNRAKVRDLYVSTLFKLNLKYAEKLEADDVFVLSAKYGLLSLDQEIEPYNKTLNNMSAAEVKDWAGSVSKEIRVKYDIDNDYFIFLAGMKYRTYLLPYIKHYEIPLEGLRIGEQLKKLKELTS